MGMVPRMLQEAAHMAQITYLELDVAATTVRRVAPRGPAHGKAVILETPSAVSDAYLGQLNSWMSPLAEVIEAGLTTETGPARILDEDAALNLYAMSWLAFQATHFPGTELPLVAPLFHGLAPGDLLYSRVDGDTPAIFLDFEAGHVWIDHHSAAHEITSDAEMLVVQTSLDPSLSGRVLTPAHANMLLAMMLHHLDAIRHAWMQAGGKMENRTQYAIQQMSKDLQQVQLGAPIRRISQHPNAGSPGTRNSDGCVVVDDTEAGMDMVENALDKLARDEPAPANEPAGLAALGRR